MPCLSKKIKELEKPPKYTTRLHKRCPVCGRPRAYRRYFGMCRICFREYALRGELPGVKKASW
jgi:small subunit ribosomal protein S14